MRLNWQSLRNAKAVKGRPSLPNARKEYKQLLKAFNELFCFMRVREAMHDSGIGLHNERIQRLPQGIHNEADIAQVVVVQNVTPASCHSLNM